MNLYFRCKEMGVYPLPGGPLEQTSFTIALFDYLDGVVSESHQKTAIAQANKAKK